MKPEMRLLGPVNEVNPVLFDDINANLVKKVALKMRGAAGPSCFDANDWRGVLVSMAAVQTTYVQLLLL